MPSNKVIFVFAILLGVSTIIGPSLALSDDDTPKTAAIYLLRSSVIGSAGSPGTSTQFQLAGTMGQPSPVGVGSSTGFVLSGGFWNKIETSTGVDDGVTPSFFRNALYPNTPNPFNPLTTIHYEVKETSPVEITIYNIQGRLVRSLVSETRQAGRHEFVWDGRNDHGRYLSSGMFFCHFQVGPHSDVRKMLLLK